MKTVGIRDFKAHLSEYLREVRAGETVRITDRGQVVAEVRSPGRAPASDDSIDARLQRAAAAGRVRRAKVPLAERAEHLRRLREQPPDVKLDEGVVERYLDELRGDESSSR